MIRPQASCFCVSYIAINLMNVSLSYFLLFLYIYPGALNIFAANQFGEITAIGNGYSNVNEPLMPRS
jgi:hypothetical protein